MNQQRHVQGVVGLLLGLTLAWPAVGGPGGGQKKDQPPKQKPDLRTGIAVCQSPTGTLIAAYGPGPNSLVVRGKGVLFPDDLMLALPGYRAEVETLKAEARLALVGNVQVSATPVRESAVRLHKSAGVPLDFTLDRGRVFVRAHQAKEPVRVRVRALKEVLELELEPGAEVALERFSRWLPGVPFLAKPKKGHEPVTEVHLLLLKGRIKAKLNDDQGEQTFQGRMLYQWNSDRGVVGPIALKKVPDWAADKPEPLAKDVQAALEKLTRALSKKEPATVIEENLGSSDAATRALMVAWAEAIDQPGRVWEALNDSKHADARAAAVLSLRHWIGRGTANDVALYRLLLNRKLKPAHAEIVMQLLHGFTDADRARPETYEALIGYLDHDQLAIRALSHWHLVRLVPKGGDIAYDAGAAQRAAGVAAWRKLVPAGQLPAAEKK